MKKLDSLAVCVLYWGLLVCLMCVRSSKEAATLYSVVVLLSFTILAINTILQYALFYRAVKRQLHCTVCIVA